jgi:hypothetical protein
MPMIPSVALVPNRYFDELSATPGLYWLGQDTNHIGSHPSVSEAMVRSSEAGEFDADAPPLLVECYRRQGMIRHGTYRTQRFGDRFVKVSTSVPSPWVEKFCTLLPEMVTQARTLNDLPPQF